MAEELLNQEPDARCITSTEIEIKLKDEILIILQNLEGNQYFNKVNQKKHAIDFNGEIRLCSALIMLEGSNV